MMDNKPQKSHVKRSAGRKAERKKDTDKKRRNVETEKSRNPKAFTAYSAVNSLKMTRRNLDLQTKRHHVPLVDRTSLEPPPMVVAIVGPPGVGKTCLMKSLIKHYAKIGLPEVNGPVTVVAGKKRRLTLIECANDMNTMIDVAKVADLILLMVDASFGFEMETFEFLNVLQVHGFPRVMGVLTHLDHFKDNKKLKKTKKLLKHRFWTEIFQGAKLFYLSGLIAGKYAKNEIANMVRFIAVMKFRPLIWRNTHPYFVCDRVEDLTDPEAVRRDKKLDRTVALYGYVRGTHLKPSMKIHVAGAGDFFVRDISILPDPCPLPDATKMRGLNAKERLLYAPLSNAGDIVYDKDAVYIDMPKPSAAIQVDSVDDVVDNGNNKGAMLSELVSTETTFDASIDAAPMRFFSEAPEITSAQFERGHDDYRNESESGSDEDDEHGDDESSYGSDSDEFHTPMTDSVRRTPLSRESADSTGRIRRKAMFDDELLDEDPDHGKSLHFADDSDGEDFEDAIEATDDESDDDDDDNDYDEEYENDSGDDEGNEEVVNDDVCDKDHADEISGSARWKEQMLDRAANNFLSNRRVNLMNLVYGTSRNIARDGGGNDDSDASSNNDKENEDDDLFKTVRRHDDGVTGSSGIDAIDSSKSVIMNEKKASGVDNQDQSSVDLIDSIRNRFITGDWGEDEDAAKLLANDAAGADGDDVYGDFEDLETGDVISGRPDEEEQGDGNMSEAELLLQKKLAKKASFDSCWDDPEIKGKLIKKDSVDTASKSKTKKSDNARNDEEDESYYDEVKRGMAEQAVANRAAFENDDENARAMYEGYRPGLYVRVEVARMPCEFLEHFDPKYPVIVGGLLNNEETLGMLQLRMKKHRWHKKILKTNDPLIISVGWRRYQSTPLYSIMDVNKRHRLLKYTPEHMHCHATFYGPLVPPNTGVLCVQSVASKAASSRFRVAATGVVLEVDQKFAIVKKLKLTGVPYKIFKHTAFIRDMFNSSLEVSKFEGAGIRTVSGVRGQIKKAERGHPGAFRATFEDKVLMSDIMFLRTWYPVEPRKFYNPIASLLLSDKQDWEGMRLTGVVRHELNKTAPKREDSKYKKISREVRKFNTLKIPKALQKELPFKSKPKLDKKRSRQTYMTKRAVVMEPGERKAHALLQQIATVHNDQQRKRKEKASEQSARYVKEKAAREAKKDAGIREQRKRLFRSMDKEEKRKDSKRQKSEKSYASSS